MATPELYAELGVKKSASADDIKKAYRKLARKFHPDVNQGEAKAEERFKRISVAHDILSDPDKRGLYDEFGFDGLQAGFDPTRARQFKRGPGPQPQGDFGGYSFEDILGDLFGQRATRGSQGRRKAPAARGADLESSLEIDFLEAVRGTSATIALQKPVTCTTCRGSGMDGATRRCPTCYGTGAIEKSERLRVKIPAGVDDGSRVRLAGKGGAGSGGGAAGDLFIATRVRPHPLLRRLGQDLALDLPITIGEALLGAQVTVPTPAGNVKVKIPVGSQSGAKLRLRGKGVPRMKGSGHGDFYVVLQVHVPDRTDDGVREAIQTLEKGYSRDPRADVRL